MTSHQIFKSAAAGVLVAMTIAAGGPATAEGLTIPPIRDATVAKECGACHMAYPAGLLPARSWAAMMTRLDDHFGDNAALDADMTKRISDYLIANAADSRGATSGMLRGLPLSAAPARIIELPAWQRKHERKDRVSRATLARKGAKSKSDCVACHADAARGYFDDE